DGSMLLNVGLIRVTKPLRSLIQQAPHLINQESDFYLLLFHLHPVLDKRGNPRLYLLVRLQNQSLIFFLPSCHTFLSLSKFNRAISTTAIQSVSLLFVLPL